VKFVIKSINKHNLIIASIITADRFIVNNVAFTAATANEQTPEHDYDSTSKNDRISKESQWKFAGCAIFNNWIGIQR